MEQPLTTLRSSLTAAAIDPTQWPDALKGLEQFMGCSDLHLISLDPSKGAMLQNYPLNAREAIDEFQEIVDLCEPVQYAARNPGWEIIKDQDFITDDEIRRSPFYEWATQFDATYRLGIRLLLQADADVHLWFLKAKSQGPVTADDIKNLDRISGELRLTAQVSHDLIQSDLYFNRFTESFELTETAALIVGRSGTVTSINNSARRLLRNNAAIDITRSKLNLNNSDYQRQFSNLLESAIRLDPSELGPRGGQMLVRGSRAELTRISVISLPVTDPFLNREIRSALVVFFQIPRTNRNNKVEFGKIYNLTEAELRVTAAFSEGLNLKEISERFEVSLATIQTQMKSILSKTECRRQAELMQLVTLHSL